VGNIAQSLKSVLKGIKDKSSLEAQLKDILLPKEHKHIKKVTVYKKRLIIYVDSPAALYELRLKKEDIFKKLREKDIPQTSLSFKIGM